MALVKPSPVFVQAATGFTTKEVSADNSKLHITFTPRYNDLHKAIVSPAGIKNRRCSIICSCYSIKADFLFRSTISLCRFFLARCCSIT